MFPAASGDRLREALLVSKRLLGDRLHSTADLYPREGAILTGAHALKIMIETVKKCAAALARADTALKQAGDEFFENADMSMAIANLRKSDDAQRALALFARLMKDHDLAPTKLAEASDIAEAPDHLFEALKGQRERIIAIQTAIANKTGLLKLAELKSEIDAENEKLRNDLARVEEQLVEKESELEKAAQKEQAAREKQMRIEQTYPRFPTDLSSIEDEISERRSYGLPTEEHEFTKEGFEFDDSYIYDGHYGTREHTACMLHTFVPTPERAFYLLKTRLTVEYKVELLFHEDAAHPFYAERIIDYEYLVVPSDDFSRSISQKLEECKSTRLFDVLCFYTQSEAELIQFADIYHKHYQEHGNPHSIGLFLILKPGLEAALSQRGKDALALIKKDPCAWHSAHEDGYINNCIAYIADLSGLIATQKALKERSIKLKDSSRDYEAKQKALKTKAQDAIKTAEEAAEDAAVETVARIQKLTDQLNRALEEVGLETFPSEDELAAAEAEIGSLEAEQAEAQAAVEEITLKLNQVYTRLITDLEEAQSDVDRDKASLGEGRNQAITAAETVLANAQTEYERALDDLAITYRLTLWHEKITQERLAQEAAEAAIFAQLFSVVSEPLSEEQMAVLRHDPDGVDLDS